MPSAVNSIFIVKYDFFKKDNIPQYAKVIIITIINNSCLIEDITLKRVWVMKYDIYPVENHDFYGYWEYNEEYQNIVKNLDNSIINNPLNTKTDLNKIQE